MFSTNHDPPPNSALPTYRVFTDGSATVKRTRTGAWCAVILAPDGTRHDTCGCAAPTTIGRMELRAINAALEFILDREDGCRDGYKINVLCDSQYVVFAAQGIYKRDKNKADWKMFDCLSEDMKFAIGWTPRNTVAEQAECDQTCDNLRRGLESFLNNEEV